MSKIGTLFKVLGKLIGVASKRSLGLFTFIWSHKRWLTVVGIVIIFFTPIIKTYFASGGQEALFLLGKNLFLPDLQIQLTIKEIIAQGNTTWWEAVKLRGQLLAPLSTLGVIIYALAKLFDFVSRDSALKSLGIAVLLLGIGEVIFISLTQDVNSISQLLPFRGLVWDLPKNILVILDPFIPFFDSFVSFDPNTTLSQNFTGNETMNITTNSTSNMTTN